MSNDWQADYDTVLAAWQAHSSPTDVERWESALRALVQASQFATQHLLRNPAQLSTLTAMLDQADYSPEVALTEAMADVTDEDDFMAVLRQWRNRHQIWLIWQEVLQHPALPERLESITQVADLAINCATEFATAQMVSRFGEPARCPFSGQPQRLVVLGMGKLGARELNLSSDIDLIFSYPTEGETDGKRSLTHGEFFTRVGRKIIQYLDQRTVDGFVHRVDMRLRPNGQSGPLALNFRATETYYQEQGRDWERYALIKARAVTSVEVADNGLMPKLKAFVFRRYVDYQVLDALREMKQRIAAENRRLQRQANIKLGSGGIREVEFIVQAVQLIQGGQSHGLQNPDIFAAMDTIMGEQLLPEAVCMELLDSYQALRRLEHLIQAQEDRQTQELPTDDRWRTRLAQVMGFDDWTALLAWTADVRGVVSRHFDAFIAPPDEMSGAEHPWEPFWRDIVSADWALDFGDEGQDVAAAVQQIRDEAEKYHLSEIAWDRLDRFMPLLLNELARLQRPADAITRLTPVVQGVLRRSAYLIMLVENPQAIRELVKLVMLSPWVADQFVDKAYLLDELTDPDELYRLPSRRALGDDLKQRLLRLPDDDLEQQMEQLRHFRHSRVLRAAACELTGNLPLMKISDYLTYTAEEVLQQVQWLAWDQMTDKHGVPSREDGQLCDPDFVILAYGKMGGLELSYESDLDLVFVHDGAPQGQTNGIKPVDNNVFFMRLGQRIVHLLTTQTPSGILYEVDMRLRPSGNSGMLVCSLSAFRKYQENEAWTWEHQALVRARVVAGCPRLKEAVERVRADVIRRPRDPAQLWQEVTAMRDKMRVNLGTPVAKQAEQFNIKQDPGGVVDIEFLVQFLLLRHAAEDGDLVLWSDNMRLLETLNRCQRITDDERNALSRAYLKWRQEVHRQALQNGDGKLHGADQLAEFDDIIQTVRTHWQKLVHVA